MQKLSSLTARRAVLRSLTLCGKSGREDVMTRVRNLLICFVLLGLVGVLHHKWLQMSGDSGFVTPASAATLSNGSLQTCNGTGTWHFVNPQNGGDCEPLTVD